MFDEVELHIIWAKFTILGFSNIDIWMRERRVRESSLKIYNILSISSGLKWGEISNIY